MKNFTLSLICILGVLTSVNAQTLPTPVFTSLPCFLAPGVTVPITISNVTGATSYCYTTQPGSINGILFNGQVSPVCTTSPSVLITGVLPQPYYIVCVTAISACCTSATTCDTIPNTPVISFASTNSSTAVPGTSGIYSIIPECIGGVMFYIYTVTGDITINGLGDTLNINNDSITLYFGPSFTSGTLCVRAITNFGVSGPTICMPINLFTGNNNPVFYEPTLSYNSSSNQFVVEWYHNVKSEFLFEVHDLQGRLIQKSSFNNNSAFKKEIDLVDLSKGLYVATLTGNNTRKSIKFSTVK